VSNQYGLAGRAARNWGPDTLEGSLSEEELRASRRSQPEDAAKYRFRNEEYYKTKDYELSDIEVPLLSVANWVSTKCVAISVALDQLTYKGRNPAASPR
jgi:hypothetical protein